MTEHLSVFLTGVWKHQVPSGMKFLAKESFAYDTRTQRSVALRQEIAILWTLRNERGIVRMIGFDQLSYRILLEPYPPNVPPVHLHAFLTKYKFDTVAKCGFTRDLARGLRALHRAGVVHMDLSASSVMVVLSKRRQFSAVISNLSACRILADAPKLRREEVIGGVPDPLQGRQWNAHFQAPELVQQRKIAHADATKPSNVFSLGVLINVLITRHCPELSDYTLDKQW
jgi:serine/threonine protein kinase